jgi:acyl carrier protein
LASRLPIANTSRVKKKNRDFLAGFASKQQAQIRRKFTLLDRINHSSTERVAHLVRELLAKRSIDRPVGNDDSLTESGLTSLDIVNLMLGIETEFGIKIPDRDMTPSNFRSIAQIDQLIGRLLGTPETAPA